MEIESIGPYSPDTVYGQLSSPFTPKAVTINSHTPFDKVDENDGSKVFSREFFKGKPQAKLSYDIGEIGKSETLNINQAQTGNSYQTQINNNLPGTDQENEFPPSSLAVFQVSSLSAQDIVQSSLKKGYTPTEAVNVSNARNAYEKSILMTGNFAETLSTCSYKVV